MHSQNEPITLDLTPSVSESNTPTKPWLLWTGVVGAIFALFAMAAVLALSQKLEVQANLLAKLAEAASQPQALVSTLRQEFTDNLTQQQTTQAQLLQQQNDLITQFDTLAQQKATGWQLTDPVAIRFMLAQLQASSQLNPDPIRLAGFLTHWQATLLEAKVKPDHALLQAIISERDALRSDLPNWQSEAATWQQLKQALAIARPAITMSQTITPESGTSTENDTSDAWWQRLTSLVRIRPAGVSDAELAQTLSQRGIWPVQTALALSVIQVGFLTNQPQLVNQSSEQLSILLSQQTPELLNKWQPRLQLWQSWQGVPQPAWHYLHNYLKQASEQAQ
jgi:hypothetical protein